MEYKIKINREKCISCGMCVGNCPDLFELAGDGKSKPKKAKISEEEKKCADKAAKECPVQIISVEKA